MVRRLYWTAWAHLRRTGEPRRELTAFGALAPEAARELLGQRLLAQLRHFGRRADALPEWRAAADELHTVDDVWAAWPQLPIVTKEDLRTRFNPREMKERFGLEGVVTSTGGSTGEPTPFMIDPPLLQSCMARALHVRTTFGWEPGMPIVCIWGSERDIGKTQSARARFGAWLRNDWVVDGYAMNQGTVDAVLDLVRRRGPVAMYGFTSMLEFVARSVLERGERVPAGAVRTAWNGGEMLYEHQSEVFEQAFGVPILNCYGGRELGEMAFQPGRDTTLKVLRPDVIVDVVNDQGQPVGPGEIGRLLWTSTVTRGTPFLRYDVGDLGTYAASGVDEAGIGWLESLEGRRAGLITLPSGKTISCLYWNHLFKEFNEVTQFQLVQKADGSLHFRLRGTPFSAEREAALRQVLADFLGEVRVDWEWVDKLELTSQGKLEQVIREPVTAG